MSDLLPLPGRTISEPQVEKRSACDGPLIKLSEDGEILALFLVIAMTAREVPGRSHAQA